MDTEKLNNALTRIAVLENSQNTVKEDLKSVRKDIENISSNITKINETIENRFTSLDKQKIEDLRTNKNLIIGIIISIITSVAVPVILTFWGIK